MTNSSLKMARPMSRLDQRFGSLKFTLDAF
jgi:hypothetical protein